jgi:CheY-like chemotaxis protein/signal transduction histidine kinase
MSKVSAYLPEAALIALANTRRWSLGKSWAVPVGAVLLPSMLWLSGLGSVAQQSWQQALSLILSETTQVAATQQNSSLAWNFCMALCVLCALWQLTRQPLQGRRTGLVLGTAAVSTLALALVGRAFSAADTQPQWPLLALLGMALAHAALVMSKRWSIQREAQREVLRREVGHEVSSVYLSQLTAELRGSTHAVLALSDLVIEQAPSGKPSPEMSALRRAAESLNQSLLDIEEMAAVHAHRLQLQITNVALLPLVHEQVNQIRQEAESKGLRLQLSVATDLPRRVMADASRVGQVLAHLLNHSVRSTRQGQIQLELRRHPRQPRMVRILVTDTSMSSISGTLSSITTPFCEAVQERARHGTGIGMNLAKQLAVLMGGKLSVRHSNGRGNVMIFTALLPEASALPDEANIFEPTKTEPPAPVAQESQPELNLSLVGDGSKVVLLVDDNASTRALIQAMLETERYRVVCCSTGAEAIRALNIAPYDIVLVDLYLAGMDGMATVQQLRQLEAQRRLVRTPAIALGAAPFDLERRKCLDAGFDDHLCKPVRRSRLLETISGLLSAKSSDRGTEQQATQSAHRYVHRDALNLLAQDNCIDVHDAVASLGGNSQIYLDAIEQLTPALYNWPARFQETLQRGDIERARQMALDMQSILEVVRARPCAQALGSVALTLLEKPLPTHRREEALTALDRQMLALLQCLRQAVDRLKEGRLTNGPIEKRQNSAL